MLSMDSGRKIFRKSRGIFMSKKISSVLFLIFSSTCAGLKMGLISELPINSRFATKLTDDHLRDPFKLAQALREDKFE